MEPDPDDPELWLPYVDGAIDGRAHRFLLDTGAGQTRIRADATTAQLPVVGTKQSRGVFGTVTDDLVMLQSLEIGPIAKADLTVVRTPAGDRPSLVGMDTLGGMAMVLDLDQANVDLVPSGCLHTTWPMRRSPNGQPFLEAVFPGVSALACWDTGAAVTVVNTSFHASHEELFTPIGTSTGYDSAGHAQETPMYLMAACTVGGITLAAHKVATVPLPQDPMPMDLVLGYPALRQFVWTMDYPLDRWAATAADVR
jgi:gag-polyprotein putative aspartyl protease/Aspartyl protease